MEPWHLRDPVAFARETQEVEREFPQLHASVAGERTMLSGSISVHDGTTVLDRFLVEIILLPDYPCTLPKVFEVGGRIPRTLDRHCYEDDGSACVLLPEERWRIWPRGSSLLAFIKGPVVSYFISQAIFEREGRWPFGEWEHGFFGLKQYYRETFGTDVPAVVERFFDFLIARKVKKHWLCPCGTGIRVGECHGRRIAALRAKIPRADARLARERLRRYVKRIGPTAYGLHTNA